MNDGHYTASINYYGNTFYCGNSHTGREIGTDTFEVHNVFPPDDLWLDSDAKLNYVVIYNQIINVWDIVSAFIPIPRMFQSTGFLFEKRIR